MELPEDAEPFVLVSVTFGVPVAVGGGVGVGVAVVVGAGMGVGVTVDVGVTVFVLVVVPFALTLRDAAELSGVSFTSVVVETGVVVIVEVGAGVEVGVVSSSTIGVTASVLVDAVSVCPSRSPARVAHPASATNIATAIARRGFVVMVCGRSGIFN
ncbi:hypothetical protein [Halococcus sp. PRR34]|uniref:hypothetical protein n=1 Tax=Halococcus sp. PRR34 TaxID=3020830 RepID=UPI002362FA69|nr:hypothetical protein [Halococcus sp. PRR34]